MWSYTDFSCWNMRTFCWNGQKKFQYQQLTSNIMPTTVPNVDLRYDREEIFIRELLDLNKTLLWFYRFFKVDFLK